MRDALTRIPSQRVDRRQRCLRRILRTKSHPAVRPDFLNVPDWGNETVMPRSLMVCAQDGLHLGQVPRVGSITASRVCSMIRVNLFVSCTILVICILLLPFTGLGQTVDSLFAQGKALRVEGNKQKAVDVFAKVLERAPGHVESLVQMGAAYEDQKKWGDAILCYQRALNIDPNNPMAVRNLKQLQSSQVVNSTVKVANPASEHLIQLGLKAFRRGDLKRAFEVFRLCRGLLRDDPRPLLFTAVILERTGKTRHAISLYERTIEAFPKFAPARVNHVIALLASGDRKTALRRAQESLEVLPGDIRLNYLARWCSQQGLETASNLGVANTFTEDRAP